MTHPADTDIDIREMTETDRPIWLRMYRALFPDDPESGLNIEITRILSSPDRMGIVAFKGGTHVGFAEYARRPYANGCRSQPVPFLEGIWVDPDHRRQGVARRLLDHLEAHARAEGFCEFGSDVLLDNLLSLDVHRQLGFEETERVVYFRKDI